MGQSHRSASAALEANASDGRQSPEKTSFNGCVVGDARSLAMSARGISAWSTRTSSTCSRLRAEVMLPSVF